MKLILIISAILLIASCKQDEASQKTNTQASPKSTTVKLLSIDTSTPDRALKSYWLGKDAINKAEIDSFNAIDRNSEYQKIRESIGFDAKKLMSGDALSAYQGRETKTDLLFEEYSREIIEIKQETESRAVAMVKVRNVTPVPDGVVIPEPDKKTREEGKSLKYILEKEENGWRVSQIYETDEFGARYQGKDLWKKIFSAPDDEKTAEIYVNAYQN